jgi:hypothetical protein
MVIFYWMSWFEPNESYNGAGNGSVPWPLPFDTPNWCATASAEAASTDPHNLTGSHGQACFCACSRHLVPVVARTRFPLRTAECMATAVGFSNGCDISVDECDGDTGQKVDAKWIYTGPGKNNGWTSEGIVLDPKHKQPGGGIHAMSIAAAQGKKPLRNATICDPSIRTVRTSYLAVHGRAHLPGSTWPTADALWP